MLQACQQSAVRFFLWLLLFCEVSTSATLQSFGDEQFYPVVERASGIKSSQILLSGLALTALSYERQYEVPKASQNDFRTGESLSNGVFSLGLIATQFVFDSDSFNVQSHLRGLVYDVTFMYFTKALLAGQWPGANYDYQAFPSVHASIAFMSATSLTYAYGWPAALLAYPAAAFAASTRLGYDCHRLSDVIAGATIGVWLGRASYYENADAAKDLRLQKNPKLTHYEVIPIIGHNQFGTSFYYFF